MTTFKTEYQDLIKDYYEKTKDLHKLYPWEGGLDGKAEEERRKYAQEYQKKLYALKEKYGTQDLQLAKQQAN